MSAQTDRLWGIDEDERVLVHTGSDGSKVVVVKGEKVKKYSDFDIQIRLEGDGYETNYTPSHPDVFRDLDLKIRATPENKERLFGIIKSVFEGEDPDSYAGDLSSITFEREKFPADVTVSLLQQMMIEQEINYGPGGSWTRFSPPRDLLMSCVRWIFSEEYDDIQEVIQAGYRGKTPKKYQWDGEDIWTRPRL